LKEWLPMIVKFEVEESQIQFLKSELIKLLVPTRAEQGCLRYDLHQDLDFPHIFMFYEVWETKDLWKAHDSKQHVLDLKKALESINVKITFHQLKLI
jgi:quinol monooxygenase YgiN